MNQKEKLLKQLIVKMNQKSRGFKLLIGGIGLGVLNFILDGLYNALMLLSYRGDLGETGKKIISFFQASFFLLLIFWLLLWIVAIILTFWGLFKWLNARSEIEKIKLELEVNNS
ncbi:MAG: hypothetical protein MRERV_6c064 [Mycoplasmataceae bacterium RV_VA103A]|nr:MAG: hypothetical protein MRERV_6c064 [Mycoplasmataceae bacterium RV_VA103A]